MCSGRQISVYSHRTETSIRDLSDFCLRWPELQVAVERGLSELRSRDGGEQAEEFAQLVHWLCLLADRACLDD